MFLKATIVRKIKKHARLQCVLCFICVCVVSLTPPGFLSGQARDYEVEPL